MIWPIREHPRSFRADRVAFPVDCVSHDAALTVKRLCRQLGKPWLPLRSAGLRSFLAALAGPAGDLAIGRRKARGHFVPPAVFADVHDEMRTAQEEIFGPVWVCCQAMDPAVPFGGSKMSGHGRESGKQHVEEYLNAKTVWIKTG